jgi:hypothetical protein
MSTIFVVNVNILLYLVEPECWVRTIIHIHTGFVTYFLSNLSFRILDDNMIEIFMENITALPRSLKEM